MKNYLCSMFLAINPFAVSLFCFYLVGSFLGVSWNPADWTEGYRITMIMFGLCFGCALYVKLSHYD